MYLNNYDINTTKYKILYLKSYIYISDTKKVFKHESHRMNIGFVDRYNHGCGYNF